MRGRLRRCQLRRDQRILCGRLALHEDALGREIDSRIGIIQQLGHGDDSATFGAHRLKGTAMHNGMQQRAVGRHTRDGFVQIGL